MLTEKQKLFAKEYLIDLNATQAAIRAGYSKKSAYSIGGELLKKPEIQDEIQLQMAERSKRTEITADNVLKELSYIAFSNATDYVQVKHEQVKDEKNGTVTEVPYIDFSDTEMLSDEQKKAISAIHYGKRGINVATHNKVRALELLARHLGMFEEQQQEKEIIVKLERLDEFGD